MDFGKEEKDSSCEVIKGPFIFIEATKKISIASGKTKISLPTVISGKRSLDCIRMKFTSNGKSMTEQNFVEKMNFLLLFSEGTLLPATGIQFVREDSVKFPENFVLKAFFALPEKLSKSDCFLIVENKFSHAFSVSEVSVGSLPFSEK